MRITYARAEQGTSLIEIVVAGTLLSLIILGTLKADHWVLDTLRILRVRRDDETESRALLSATCTQKIISDLLWISCRSPRGDMVVQLEER